MRDLRPQSMADAVEEARSLTENREAEKQLSRQTQLKVADADSTDIPAVQADPSVAELGKAVRDWCDSFRTKSSQRSQARGDGKPGPRRVLVLWTAWTPPKGLPAQDEPGCWWSDVSHGASILPTRG